MSPFIQGTFHFHSTYSHDGKHPLKEVASTLQASGFAFGVMTEHFEDFDAATVDRYIAEAKEITETTGFVLVPGIEVHLRGLDTIVFPVRRFEQIQALLKGEDSDPKFFKVLAHPARYRFEDVERHIQNFRIDAVELWNQQADGAHIPPMEFLRSMRTLGGRNRLRYFFGCDNHSAHLRAVNVLCLPESTPRTADAIANALASGQVVARNLFTGIEYRNGAGQGDFDRWFELLQKRSYVRGRILKTLRRVLRTLYKALPRNAQHSLNDFKNAVRNRV
jgi:hypothetical protein